MAFSTILRCFRCGWATLVALSLSPICALQDVEDFPNLLAGSFTDGQRFSTGNTLPLIGRPWGFNHFSPQTGDGKSAWWFRGDAVEFRWLRLTHQPSPWIGDWAWLNLGPQMGNLESNPVMFFEPWAARIKPYTFDATLGPDNMRVQLAPTMHGAILKVTFPVNNPMGLAKRVCFGLPADDTKKRSKGGAHSNFNAEEMWLEMVSMRAEEVPSGFSLYVRAEVDKSALQYRPEGEHVTTTGAIRCFNFSPKETTVIVRLATSLISFAQAKLNLAREVGQRSFEEVEIEGKMVWRSMLGRVRVVDPGPLTKETTDRLTIFYTGLYRALTFPRRLDEVDENGKVVHYSPYKPGGGVFDGILVTDNGFWDTFRTVYPLLNLIYPKEAGEIVSGWLNAFKEGGWLPEWSSPGYRVCMVGTFADVVVADAVVKSLPGIDTGLAWEAMNKDSFGVGERGGHAGKKNYQEYATKGYIPLESNGDAASATLDFAFSDYSVSFAAEKLGHTTEAKTLRNRAVSARNLLFDHSWGLMRAKRANGEFKLDNPVSWGNGFVEGASWQHSFPPYDLAGLSHLHGSYEALARKILQMLSTPGSFQPGSYRRTIHEMEEMRALGMGQYAHSNQPVHHILWLLLALDEGKDVCAADAPTPGRGILCPRRAGEEAIHDTLHRAYSTQFFAGDEDNGEMGSWYVLAALGLFDPAPGTPHGYALGSPLFRKVEVRRSADADEPDLTIVSGRAGGSEVAYVSRVLLNGNDVGIPASAEKLGWTLSYDKLFSSPHAQLRFVTAGEQAAEPANVQAEEAEQQPEPLPAVKFLKPRGGAAAPAAEAAPLREVALPLSNAHPIAAAAVDERPQARQTAAPPLPQSSGEEAESFAAEKWKSQVEVQKARIQALELQLTQHHQTKEDDVNAGLLHLAQVGSAVFILVNSICWILCCWYRGGSSSSSGSNGGRRALKYTSRGNKVAPATAKKEGMAV
mmetsp:Transcript_32077/g.75265  ORF Transcript_32077/g.75265 Transcript_32077/m.75265 type:complete len:970 (-) Transcript_32077:14-2923(-)